MRIPLVAIFFLSGKQAILSDDPRCQERQVDLVTHLCDVMRALCVRRSDACMRACACSFRENDANVE